MNPKISIITITYNSEKTVEETIKSVLSQNYDNLEYIIIDGASKDGTMDIVNRYRDKIAYVVSEPDKGISDAFNKGIKAATGDIIGIINSDDLLMPNALRELSLVFDPAVDVYLGNVKIYNPESGSTCIAEPSEKYDVNMRKMVVCHPSTFITKRAYNRHGTYKTDFRYMMDMDILIRLYQGGAVFKRINKELSQFTCGGVTDNTNFKKGIMEYKKMLSDNGASPITVNMFILRSTFYRLTKEIFIRLGIWEFMRKHKYN